MPNTIWQRKMATRNKIMHCASEPKQQDPQSNPDGTDRPAQSGLRTIVRLQGSNDKGNNGGDQGSDWPSPDAVPQHGPGDGEIISNAPQNERPSPALCVPAPLRDHALDEAQPLLQFLLGGVVLHGSSPLRKLEFPRIPSA